MRTNILNNNQNSQVEIIKLMNKLNSYFSIPFNKL